MAKFQLNPGEILIGSGDDVNLFEAGTEQKAVSGEHIYYQSAGVFQNQHDARRIGYGSAVGRHQGIFGERCGDIYPGNNPQPEGRNLFLYGLSCKETAGLDGAVGRAEIVR